MWRNVYLKVKFVFCQVKNFGKGQDEEVRSYLIAMTLSKDVKRFFVVCKN